MSAVRSLRTGRSSVRMLIETTDFCLLQNVHMVSEAHSDLYFTDTKDSFRGNKTIGREVTTHRNGVPRLRMSGFTPLLHPHAFIG